MFELSIETNFSSAHRLIDYPGDCARLHGHNWQVGIILQGHQLNQLGICMDFREIKKRVRAVVAELDHSNLNDHPAFVQLNPTSETLARHLYQAIRQEFVDTPVEIKKVIVTESRGTSAAYFE